MHEAPQSWIVELRRRLESPPAVRLPAGDGRQASVLVPLYVDAGELWTLLTRRTDEVPHHKGQIAFPGGGLELGEDHWQAALRETEEELGVERRAILPLGQLDELETPTGYRIVPCVGAVPFPLKTQVNEAEIAEVFAAPLLAFSDYRMVEDRAVRIDGVQRTIRVYHLGGRQVWGLTAVVLQKLLHRLGFEPLDESS